MNKSIELSKSYHTILGHTKAFFSGTLISRFSGMFRDIILAMFFGTSSLLANFMVAFRLSNFFRRVLAESPLSASFIPSLESFKKESEEKGALYFKDAFVALLILGIIITLASELLLQFFSQHFFQTEFLEIVHLIKIMIPSLIFLMLYGLFSSYLQSFGRFFIGAFAPTLFNVIWIVFAYFARSLKDQSAIELLSWGVLSAFFIQFLLTALFVLQKLKKTISLRKLLVIPHFKNLFKAFLNPYFLSMTGVGATQLNTLLDSLFSKVADASGPAYLWYAIRLEQVPLSLFAIALASALLPQLSRVSQTQREAFQNLLSQSLRKNFILLSFCSVALMLFGFMVIRLIFFRGVFNETSLFMTLRCLWAYSLGLVFQGGVIVISQAFYSLKDFKTPARSAILAVLINIVCNALLIFYFKLGAVSIALATSFASAAQFVYLKQKMSKQFEISYGINAFKGFVAVLIAATLAMISMIAFKDPTIGLIKTGALVTLSFYKTFFLAGVSGGIFCLAFALMAKWFQIDEILAIFKKSISTK